MPEYAERVAPRMKVSETHLNILRDAIAPLDTFERRERYRNGDFPKSNTVKDLDKRYRWDLLWATGLDPYFGANDYKDAHVDTALRFIVPALHHNDGLEV